MQKQVPVTFELFQLQGQQNSANPRGSAWDFFLNVLDAYFCAVLGTEDKRYPDKKKTEWLFIHYNKLGFGAVTQPLSQ